MRYLFPTDGQRIIFAWDTAGYLHSRPGLQVAVYLDPECTRPAVDLLTLDGQPFPSEPVLTVAADDPARIPKFYGPDGVESLYLRVAGSNDPPLTLNASAAQRILDLEATIAALSTQIAPLTPTVIGEIMSWLPSAAATASGLTALKRLVVNNVASITASQTAVVGQGYEVTGSTAVAVAAPSTGLQVGDIFMVSVAASYTGSSATVTSAATFAGQASPFTLVPGQQNLFNWDGTQWIVG